MTTFHFFQDSADVKNGFVQFSVNESPKQAHIFFTLNEFEDLKQAVNDFQYSIGLGIVNYGVTKDTFYIDQDGTAVHFQTFGGELSIDLYFQNPKRHQKNRRWEAFKKAVNSFRPKLSNEKRSNPK